MILNEYDLPADRFKPVGEFILNPGEEAQFFVGIYETVIPQPLLRVEFQPSTNEDQVVTSLVRIDNEGDYSLTYHFLHVGVSQVRVKVSARWSDTA